MAQSAPGDVLLLFPLFLAAVWLAVTTILGLVSGWFQLAERFPDQIAEPLLKLSWRSGSMRFGVRFSGILILSVCPMGLRVGMVRLFGPFSRNFLVPWDALRVVRKRTFFGPVAMLRFGRDDLGFLTIPAHVADRLARAAQGRWPETGITGT